MNKKPENCGNCKHFNKIDRCKKWNESTNRYDWCGAHKFETKNVK